MAAASDRKSTRLNSSHLGISYAVFCLKKKKVVFNGHGGFTGPHSISVTGSDGRQHALGADAFFIHTGTRATVPEVVFFFNVSPPTKFYTLSLHDALPN